MSSDRTRDILKAAILASGITVAALVFLPVSVSVQGDITGPSPYRQELDELYEITSRGLPPDSPVWEKQEVLRLKNNQWFEEQMSAQNKSSIAGYLKAKSLKLSLLLVALWGISFAVLFKRSKNKA